MCVYNGQILTAVKVFPYKHKVSRSHSSTLGLNANQLDAETQ